MDLTQQILWHLQRLTSHDQQRVLDFVESLAIPGDLPRGLTSRVPADLPGALSAEFSPNLSSDVPTPSLGLSHPHDPAWDSDRDDCL